jgi:hypothetical protein
LSSLLADISLATRGVPSRHFRVQYDADCHIGGGSEGADAAAIGDPSAGYCLQFCSPETAGNGAPLPVSARRWLRGVRAAAKHAAFLGHAAMALRRTAARLLTRVGPGSQHVAATGEILSALGEGLTRVLSLYESSTHAFFTAAPSSSSSSSSGLSPSCMSPSPLQIGTFLAPWRERMQSLLDIFDPLALDAGDDGAALLQRLFDVVSASLACEPLDLDSALTLAGLSERQFRSGVVDSWFPSRLARFPSAPPLLSLAFFLFRDPVSALAQSLRRALGVRVRSMGDGRDAMVQTLPPFVEDAFQIAQLERTTVVQSMNESAGSGSAASAFFPPSAPFLSSELQRATALLQTLRKWCPSLARALVGRRSGAAASAFSLPMTDATHEALSRQETDDLEAAGERVRRWSERRTPVSHAGARSGVAVKPLAPRTWSVQEEAVAELLVRRLFPPSAALGNDGIDGYEVHAAPDDGDGNRSVLSATSSRRHMSPWSPTTARSSPFARLRKSTRNVAPYLGAFPQSSSPARSVGMRSLSDTASMVSHSVRGSLISGASFRPRTSTTTAVVTGMMHQKSMASLLVGGTRRATLVAAMALQAPSASGGASIRSAASVRVGGSVAMGHGGIPRMGPRMIPGGGSTVVSAMTMSSFAGTYLSSSQKKAIEVAEIKTARAIAAQKGLASEARRRLERKRELERLSNQADQALVSKTDARKKVAEENAAYRARLAQALSPQRVDGTPLAASFDEKYQARLYEEARQKLLQSFGEKIAALGRKDVDANPEKTKKDAIVIALDAICSLGPSGVRQAARLATSMKIQWHPPAFAVAAEPSDASGIDDDGIPVDMARALPELAVYLPGEFVSRIRVSRPPGGISQLAQASSLTTAGHPGDVYHVKVSSPAGGHSTAQTLLYGDADYFAGRDRPSTLVSQPAGGHSDAGVIIFGSDGSGSAAHIYGRKRMLEYGRQPAHEVELAAEIDSSRSVLVSQPAGGHSTMSTLLNGGDEDGLIGQRGAIMVSQAPGGASNMKSFLSNESENEGKGKVRTRSRGTALASSLSADMTPAEHVKTHGTPPRLAGDHPSASAMDSKTMGSLLSSSEEGSVTVPSAHVVVSQTAGGTSTLQSVIYSSHGSHEEIDPDSANPLTHIKVLQPAGGGASRAEGIIRGDAASADDLDELARGKTSVRILQHSGGVNKVKELMFKPAPAGRERLHKSAFDREAFVGAGQVLLVSSTSQLRMEDESKHEEAASTAIKDRAFNGKFMASSIDANAVDVSSSSPSVRPQLTVSLPMLVRTVVVDPLLRRAMQVDACAAVMAVVEHSILFHYRALKWWMLFGEGHVANRFVEILVEQLNPPSGASFSARLRPRTVLDGANAANSAFHQALAEIGMVQQHHDFSSHLRRQLRSVVQRKDVGNLAALAAEINGGDGMESVSQGGTHFAQFMEDRSRFLRKARRAAHIDPALSLVHRFSFDARLLDSPKQQETNVMKDDSDVPCSLVLGSPWENSFLDFLVPAYDVDPSNEPFFATLGSKTVMAPVQATVQAAPAGEDMRDSVSLIISPMTIRRLSTVSTFLLKVKHLSFELKRVWINLMSCNGIARIHPVVHAFRHEASHFASALEGYISVQIVSEPYELLLAESISYGSSLHGLRTAFALFSKRVIDRSLLIDPCAHGSTGPKMLTKQEQAVIAGAALFASLFDIILQFCKVTTGAVETVLAAAKENDAARVATEDSVAKPVRDGAKTTRKTKAQSDANRLAARRFVRLLEMPGSDLDTVGKLFELFRRKMATLQSGLHVLSASGGGFSPVDDLLQRMGPVSGISLSKTKA